MTGRKIAAAVAVLSALSIAGEPLLPGPRVAHAASPKTPEKAAADIRARELFQKGDAAYAEGRYEEALTAFQDAFDLSGRPQLLFNISNALERLGRYGEAVEALEKYLQSGKTKDCDIVQKRLANLRRRVDEQKKAEDRAKEEEEKKRAAEEKQKNAEAAAKVGEGDRIDVSSLLVEPPPSSSGTPVLPIIVLGAGGAALAAAGVFGVLTLSARSDADAACKQGPSGRLCTAEAASAIDRDKTFGLVTDMALVSGVVLAGIGVYLLITSSKEDKASVKTGQRAGAGGVIVGSF